MFDSIIIIVVVGILLFCYSIVKYIKFFRLISEMRLKRWWQALFGLIILFLVGYVSFIYVLVCGKALDDPVLLTRLVSLVFFFGSIFVVLTTNLINSTVLSLQKEGKEKRALLQKTVDKLKKINEHLERLNKMKTEFLTIVSHQLRTPTSIIKGMLSMLVEGELEGKQEKEFLRKTFKSAERLEILISNLLAVTRWEGGLVMMKMEPEQVENIIQRVVKESTSAAQEKNLSLKYEKTEQLPKIIIDSIQIQKALFNIIDNSLRYTQEGGITVTAKKINKEIVITVEDTGIGIGEKEKERVFQKFFRSNRAIKMSPDGSGLGLFIVQKIMEAHKGRIEIESKGKEKGSIFKLILPCSVK